MSFFCLKEQARKRRVSNKKGKGAKKRWNVKCLIYEIKQVQWAQTEQEID
jgi:hypothetical protein